MVRFVKIDLMGHSGWSDEDMTRNGRPDQLLDVIAVRTLW